MLAYATMSTMPSLGHLAAQKTLSRLIDKDTFKQIKMTMI